MTFSISKSYLALCMSIAVKDGLIPNVHQPIGATIENGGFDTDQNQTITWSHMLQLTSE
jgi:CubicO group peptidase (beta-lactamase class C family)